MSATRLLSARLSAAIALGDAELETLESLAGHVRALPRGSEVLAERSHSRTLWLLRNGWAFRQKSLRDGRRQIVSVMLPGELSEKCPTLPFGAPHSIVAASDVELVAINRDGLAQASQRLPRLAEALFVEELVRGALAGEWVMSLGRRTAKERLAYFFYETFVRLRAIGLASASRYDMPLVQADVADILGMSPVHLNRTVQFLRARELVEWSDHTVHLLAPARLAKLAQFNPDLESFLGASANPVPTP